MLTTTTVNWEILPSIDDGVWHKAFIRKCDFLDASAKSWNIIDGLSLTWNEFERGAYIG